MSQEFIPPKIQEFLPEGILEKRIEKIKLTEKDHNEYINIFNRCFNCQISIWVGRDKKGYPEHCMLWYHFDDEYGHVSDGSRTGHPVCYKCKGKCYCTDKNYILQRKWCNFCCDFKCTIHDRMYDDYMCCDCHRTFLIGKDIIKCLIENKPSSLDELYDIMSDHKVFGEDLVKTDNKKLPDIWKENTM